MPTTPDAVRMLIMVGAAAFLAKLRTSGAEPVPSALAAEMVTVYSPGTVGVPEIIPVAVSTARPAGKPLAPNDVGLLLASIW